MKNSKFKILKSLLRKAYADDFMGTVVTDTGTAVTGGAKAQKMTEHLRVVYSKEVEFKAMPIMRFAQFAKVKTELMTQAGAEIQMMTYNNLKRGGALKEGINMETQALNSSMKGIKISEQGNAISVSELALQTSFTDIMSDATSLLARDMALTLDCQLRDAALKGTQIIFGRKNKTVAKIDALKDIEQDKHVLSVTTIKDAVEILATQNTPKFEGNYYVCFVHPHQSRDLRDDPAWVNANQYGSPENLFTGEIGRIDDVRFIETTLMCNGACSKDDPAYKDELTKAGSTSNIPAYEAVIFGEDYYAHAIGLPAELRDGGVDDFSRKHGVAWYGIWGADLLHPDRGVVIKTA